MAVHMFRPLIGRGPMSVSDLETRIDDWVASNAEWEDDTTPHTLRDVAAVRDGTGTTYYQMDVRFLLDDSKANLVQKFGDKLKNKVEWYRVGYHRCDHDQSDRDGCSWDDVVDWPDSTAIPNDVPAFGV